MRGIVVALICWASVLPVIPTNVEAGQTRVRGQTTRRGTYVGSHMRTTPDRSHLDNWSTKGNVNPYTGKKGTRNP